MGNTTKEKTATFELRSGDEKDIDLIAPLWQQLRQHHLSLENHLQKRFLKQTWAKRKSDIVGKASKVHLDYAIDTISSKIVGYCISSVEKQNEKQGEVDSLFIEETYRKSGIGESLMEEALAWLNRQGTENNRLLVSGSNPSVLGFYEKFEFYPLYIILQQKKKNVTTEDTSRKDV
jgi:diamine N-acetyltransferase